MNRLQKLNAVVNHVIHSTLSSFYRDSYAGASLPDNFPTDWESWRHLPILTRKMILNTPWDKRLFVPREEVLWLMPTSGTSGAGIIFSPRTAHNDAPHRAPGARRILGFRRSVDGETQATAPITIYGDAHDLERSAALAKREDVDAIDASAPLLIAFAPILARVYPLERIRVLGPHSERCTALQLGELKRLYPQARIDNQYVNSEIWGIIARSPEDAVAEHPLAVRSSPHIHLEILRTDGPLAHVGEEGRLVLTTLSLKHPFPHIRYDTGDTALLLEAQDGGAVTFEVTGRENDGQLRIPGGELREAEIENAISAMQATDIVDFAAQVHEVGGSTHIITGVTIELELVSPWSLEKYASFAKLLSEKIRVNGGRTYAAGVAFGLYAPLICTQHTPARLSGKKKRLTDRRK